MINNRIQISFFIALLLGTFAIAFFIFKPYLTPLFLAVVFAIIFKPLYVGVHKKIGSPSFASAVTLIVIVLAILVPLTFLSYFLFEEARGLYDSLALEDGGSLISTVSIKLETTLHDILPGVTLNIEHYIRQALGFVVGNLDSFFAGFFKVFIQLFLMMIALFYLLRDGSKFKSMLMKLSPLSDTYDQDIILKLETAVRSVIRGSLVIAFIQGVLTSLGFLVAGIGTPILWGIIAMIAALIPGLGTALVFLPAIGYLFLAGHLVAALGLLIWGALAVGLIDNFLSPHLMNQGIKIHPFLILLSVIGGLTYFGPVGFFAGPVTLTFLGALFHIYPEIMKRELRP